MTLSTGDKIGQYEIVEQIGSGGMATVYKAYHARLDRHVAIKIMHQTFMQDADFHARFEREARIVANLDHHYIVAVYDFDDHEGQPYLVMKFIEGETLKSLLRAGAIPLDKIQSMLTKLASALTHAHSLGILHRDIKPSNVMIDPQGEPYLTDFGLARIVQMGESTMSADMMLGTPQYISPEQAQGLPDLTPATDVYSLGIILYELVTGQVPFIGENTYAIVHKQIYAAPPSPSDVNPEIPPKVEAVLLKALAKNPSQRYDTPTAMMNAFEKAVTESNLHNLDESRISQAQSRIKDLSQHTPRGGEYVGIPAPASVVKPSDSVARAQSGFQTVVDEVATRFKEAFADIIRQLRNNPTFQRFVERLEDSGVVINLPGMVVAVTPDADSREEVDDHLYDNPTYRRIMERYPVPDAHSDSSDQLVDERSRVRQNIGAIDHDWDMSEARVRERMQRRIRRRQGFMLHVVFYLLAIAGLSSATPDIQNAIREALTEPNVVEEVGGTFLARLADLPFALIVALWWGSGLVAHGLHTFYNSGKRLMERRTTTEQTLITRYGNNWKDTLTHREYRRVRKKIYSRYKRRVRLIAQVIGSIFFVIVISIIWTELSPILEQWALADPDFPEDLRNIHELPVVPIVLLLSAISLGVTGIGSLINSVTGEDAVERAIDREMARERERSTAQAEVMARRKFKNEMLVEDETNPADIRLNADGELTDSFAQEWNQQDKGV